MKGRYDFEYDLMDVRSGRMSPTKRINLLRAGLNLIHRKASPWSWPIHMQVELTNYCNLRCRVCPIGNGALVRKPAWLDPALFERLIDEVGPYLLTLALFNWGEPLLHPQLAEILRPTQNRGLTTLVSTNGQNLDEPEVQEALIDYPPTYLIVGIDGTMDETNSKYRVGAKLEPALKGVQRLARMKYERGQRFPILHHRYIVMKHNEHEMSQLKRFSADNRFDMLTVRTLSTIDTTNDNSHTELMPDAPGYRAYQFENGQRINRNDFICERAFTQPSVLSDGTVTICSEDYNAKHRYGTLANGTSFADIWWGDKAARLRKVVNENPDRFSFCRNCAFKDRPVTDCSIQRFDLKDEQGGK
jgi:radical SAM protein with 4Fe4S-binding SPASM domain